MRRLVAAALACALLVTPATAASLAGIGAAIHGNGFNFSKPNLERAPVGDIKLGSLGIKLQSTKLKDVQKALGGTLRDDGNGLSGATWLCYNADGFAVWLISNALGGQEFVMMVAAETVAKPYAACDAAPAGLTPPDFGIPGIGAGSAELKASFGAAAGNKIAYRNDRPGGYSDTAQYIGYILKSGKVSALGVGETQVPTAH